MKKLGLIGGIGPESTILYYRKIIHGVQSKLGKENLPPIAIESLSAFQVFSMCRAGRLDDLENYVLGAIRNLAAAGAEMAALTGNTPNIVLDRVRLRAPIPIISAIEATCDEAAQRGLSSLGLLGTVFTMTNTFFKEPFERRGIKVVVPSTDQIAYIQSKIEAELEHGVVMPDTQADFVSIIEDLRTSSGIEQVALACTELPLILSDNNSPVPCLDTMEIHVEALVNVLVYEEESVR